MTFDLYKSTQLPKSLSFVENHYGSTYPMDQPTPLSMILTMFHSRSLAFCVVHQVHLKTFEVVPTSDYCWRSGYIVFVLHQEHAR